ncbi:uncharacterized protein N7443_010947 [Penicillium atrosanguineum]|uniref:uncharacterized protein n=1 Tax=Penicillium atrosanguineum TaxID=1132637 RepID=UPI00238F880D|nr:uncharacterized protein N7443_010947 [Penicillium atrosanguineum]KAJ5290694.1 hypothetical protein N7443_010947 [Penicillium atrosanguineum]
MEMKFVFINVKEPKDALQLAKETEVRSHVTRYQWKRFAHRDKRNQKKALVASRDVNGIEGQNDPGSRSSTLEPIPISPQIGGLRVDPFRSYPISAQPWIPLLVDHYLLHMAVDIPELDLPGNHGLLRTSWFPLVMTDPALFSVIMLLAASHYASLQDHPTSMRLDLLGLRYEAVSSINRGFETPLSETINDALIGAIAKMASYEAMFGSLDNYNVHMHGLARVISLRGGLASLGLNGLLKRIVIWIDHNAAFLHGSAMYFAESSFMPGEGLPDPNPGHFLGSS